MARRVIYKLVSRLLFTKWHDKQDVAFLSSNVSPEEPSRAAQRRKRGINIIIQKPWVSDFTRQTWVV